MKRPSALITGVSTGIGYHTSVALIKAGYHVFGTLRSPSDVERLTSDLGEHFTPLLLDVRDIAALVAAVQTVEKALAGKGLDVLINNAGIAIGGPLQHQPWDEIRAHFDINVLGLLAVTRAFLPLLGAREGHSGKPGRIVNISSVSGKVAYPFLSSYIGSKHAVEGISHSLRRELMGYGIDVIIIGLGSVQTPIWEKGIHPDRYTDTGYGKSLKQFSKMALGAAKGGYPVAQIGDRLARIVQDPKPKARYAIVRSALTNYWIPLVLPSRLFDKIVARLAGF